MRTALALNVEFEKAMRGTEEERVRIFPFQRVYQQASCRYSGLKPHSKR